MRSAQFLSMKQTLAKELRHVGSAAMLVGTLVAGAVLGSVTWFAPSEVHAQAAKIGGQVVALDREKNTVTLKAVMGHRTLRVLRPALLDGLKVGDEILLAVGQDGKEIVVTEIEVLKK
jgi:Cu/Ag efflux protein CusF